MKLPKFKITKPRQLALLIALIVIIAALWFGLSIAAKHRSITEVQIVNKVKKTNLFITLSYLK